MEVEGSRDWRRTDATGRAFQFIDRSRLFRSQMRPQSVSAFRLVPAALRARAGIHGFHALDSQAMVLAHRATSYSSSVTLLLRNSSPCFDIAASLRDREESQSR